MENIRHGDVFLLATSSIPKSAKRRTADHEARVLARGEATGHAHVLTGDVDLFESEDGTLYVRGKPDSAIEQRDEDGKGRLLVNDGHGRIDLKPNQGYKVVHPEEYTPEGWQRVAD